MSDAAIQMLEGLLGELDVTIRQLDTEIEEIGPHLWLHERTYKVARRDGAQLIRGKIYQIIRDLEKGAK